MEVPRLGVNLELQLLAYTLPQKCRIRAASATYSTSHSKARSFTHWARPEIEPKSSWILVRFLNSWATEGTPFFSFPFFFYFVVFLFLFFFFFSFFKSISMWFKGCLNAHFYLSTFLFNTSICFWTFKFYSDLSAFSVSKYTLFV